MSLLLVDEWIVSPTDNLTMNDDGSVVNEHG